MKGKSQKCPVCDKLTVKYESRFNSKRCSNSRCNWTAAKLTAADVPKSFLEFCLKHANSKPQERRIKKIIGDTYRDL